MIEDNTIWYLGNVGSGKNYKLAKYIDVNMSEYAPTTDAKVGLLRLGELMAGQLDYFSNNVYYWTLTPYSDSYIWNITRYGNGHANNDIPSNEYSIKPSLNLKSHVIITSGDGTKENPFEIELS